MPGRSPTRPTVRTTGAREKGDAHRRLGKLLRCAQLDKQQHKQWQEVANVMNFGRRSTVKHTHQNPLEVQGLAFPGRALGMKLQRQAQLPRNFHPLHDKEVAHLIISCRPITFPISSHGPATSQLWSWDTALDCHICPTVHCWLCCSFLFGQLR